MVQFLSLHRRVSGLRSFFGLLLSLTVLLAIAGALLPTTKVLAAPIVRLRLELAPGTPDPIPSGQSFVVRLTYECSSSIGTDTCSNMQVVSTVPEVLEVIQVLGNNDVEQTNYDPVTRQATWNFRDALPLGTTGQIEFEVRYGPGTTPTGTTGTITATISVDGGATPGTGQLTAPPATANPNPTLSKELVAGGASGDLSLYRLNLCSGTIGALDLTNSTITDTLPLGAVYVSSDPAGVYDSGSQTVVWSGITVAASGSGCRSFDLLVRYPTSDPQNGIGVIKVNHGLVSTTPFSTSDVLTRTQTITHVLEAPNPRLGLSKSIAGAENTPDTIVGGTVTTTLTVNNVGSASPEGNVALDNVQITDTIPPEYAPFAVNTGAADAVAYQLNGSSSWITGVPTGTNVAVTSFPGWSTGDYVSGLRFNFNQLTMEDRSRTVSFQSLIVNPPNGSTTPYTPTAALPYTVTNTASAGASYNGNPLSNATAEATLEIAVLKARPDPRKTIISGSPALPRGTVSYELRLRNGAFEPLTDPVIADLLPSEVILDPASITVTKNISGCATNPSFNQVANYNSSGRTLLLWSWDGSGCSLPSDDDLRISYKVTVKDGTTAGNYFNRMAVVNYDNPPNSTRTSLCADGGSDESIFTTDNTLQIDITRLCFAENVQLVVRPIASVESAKFVQGQLDTAFSRDPVVGRTVPGGLITYQLTLTNTGNLTLTDLLLVDIMPYKDASSENVGVRDQTPLGTAWTVKLAGPVVVSPTIPGLSIRYSSELNPCRATLTDGPNPSCTPMVDGDVPGPGVWSTQMPSDPTTVRSLRFDFGSYELTPLANLRFTFPAFAPDDAPIAENGPDGTPGTSDDTNVAWNTFAYVATRTDDSSTLVAQPPRVGVEVQSATDLASYGNYVWNDVNRDGIQNELPQLGMNGVTVRLYRDDDDNPNTPGDQRLIGIQITRNDASGNPGYYLFSALESGIYFAEFVPPTGFTVTTLNAGENPANDSDLIEASGRTDLTSLSAGENDPTWDAGFYADPVSLGNRLFFDTNNDGLDNDGAGSADGSSTGIAGVDVELFLDSNGNGFLTGLEQSPIATVTTDATGFYLFTGQTHANGVALADTLALYPGQYLIGIPASQFSSGGPLAGYHSSGTTINATGTLTETSAPDPDTDVDRDDNGDTVRVVAGSPVSNPFAFYDRGVISKAVFVDTTNEPTGEDGDAGSAPGGTLIADEASNLTLDFGFYTLSLGDLAWDDDGAGGGTRVNGLRDVGESGLNGITVTLQLLPSSGTTALFTTTSSATGAYSFTGLAQGSYRVRFTPPTGYVSTRDTAGTGSPGGNLNDDDNGAGTGTGQLTSAALSLTPGISVTLSQNVVISTTGSTFDPTLDFGLARHYSLGNRVWNDANNNGLQDPGELGIRSVTLRLYVTNGITESRALGIDGSQVDDVTTNANGYYRFDNLPAGDYIVEILASELTTNELRGYHSSTGSGTPLPYEPAPDPDNDVDQDDNGTTTGAVVRSGVISLGDGSGTQEPTGDNDPGTNPLTGEAPNNQSNRTLDFGFVPIYSLGNRVWFDRDNSGALDAADGASPGLDGVVLRLLDATGNPATTITGTLVPTQATSGGGYYRFDNLPAGDYLVEVMSSNFSAPGVLAGYLSSSGSLQEADPNSNVDNNDNGLDTPVTGAIRSAVITLGPGESEPTNDDDPSTNPQAGESRNDRANRTLDFGFVEPISLGNRLFFDTNNDGLDNDGAGSADGSSAGIAGVTVQLFLDGDRDGQLIGLEQSPIATATTDASGFYRFTEQTHAGGIALGAAVPLYPGQYLVGMPASQLAGGGPLAGYYSSGTTIDASGVLSETLAPDPNNQTDHDDNGTRQASGFFTGGVLSQPLLVLADLAPTGELEGAGTAPGPLSIDDDDSDLTLDFGFYTLGLGDLVWEDNGASGGTAVNGLRDGGESGLNGITVTLQLLPSNSTTALFTTTSSATGAYSFTGLAQGSYRVRLTTPTGYASTRDTAGTSTPNGNLNDDDNGPGTATGVITSAALSLSPGSTGALSQSVVISDTGSTFDPTLDFGLVRRYSLGNRVWSDPDNSGTQEAGELGLSGVSLRLLQSNGISVALDISGAAVLSQTTDADGYYRFDNLPAGDYLVEVLADNFSGSAALRGFASSSGAGQEADPNNDVDQNDNGLDTPVAGAIRSGVISLGEGSGTEEPTGDNDPSTNPLAGEAPDNQANRTLDFGFVPIYALGNRVWFDRDNSGALDAGDGASPGLDGVELRLLDATGNPATTITGTLVPTQATSGGGYYRFDNLRASDYLVEVVSTNFSAPGVLTGFLSSSGSLQEADPDSDVDNNDNGLDTPVAGAIRSGVVTLGPGNSEPTSDDDPSTNPQAGESRNDRANRTLDFGFIEPVSLGNRLFFDTDNDGLDNDGTGAAPGSSSGIAGVTVQLFLDSDRDGQLTGLEQSPIATVTTDASGFYRFTEQTHAGGIALGAAVPLYPGQYLVGMPASQLAGGGPLAGYYSSGTTIDASGVLSETLAPDPNNQTDHDDNGTRQASGFFTGGVLSQPLLVLADLAPTGELEGAGTAPGPLSIDDDDSDLTLDFGFYTLGLGDLVWEDNGASGGIAVNGLRDGGESGLAGISLTLELLPASGSTVLLTTTSSATGTYSFTGLAQGSYRVRFTPPSGYASTRDTADTNNPDGNRNDDDNGPGATTGVITSAALSLTPGSPGALSQSVVVSTTGSTVDPTLDFGLVRSYSLGNRVWSDPDNSGRQESGESGLSGVSLRLLQSNGISVALDLSGAAVLSQTTDADGYYRFDNLPAGDYLVEVLADNFSGSAALDGYASSNGVGQEPDPNSNGDLNDNGLDPPVAGAIRSGVISLGDGSGTQEPIGDNDPSTNPLAGEAPNNQSNRTLDFGFVEPVSLGNRLFFDTNNDGLDNDGAGSADGSSSGIAGVTVQLFLDRDRDGQLTGLEQSPIATVTTDATGFYSFTAQTHAAGVALSTPIPLAPGQYLVGMPASQFASGGPLAGYHSSGTTIDASGVLSETLAADPNNGIDRDDNGTLQASGATFLPGGVLSQPLLVLADLAPTGEPEGAGTAPGPLSIDDDDSDLTLDFGFYTLGLGDLVWEDNGASGGTAVNGLREVGEAGMAGVGLELLPASGSTVLLTTTSSATGTYSFTGLAEGSYRVRLTPPSGYASTRDTAGTNTPDGNFNDDDNGPGGTTGVITSAALPLVPGSSGTLSQSVVISTTGSTVDPTLDFGLVRSYSLGNRVWSDPDNSGTQEAGELGLSGVSLRLLQSNGISVALDISGAAVLSQTTDADGYYRFDNLPAGDYLVEVLADNFSGSAALRGFASSNGAGQEADPNNNGDLNDNGLDPPVAGAIRSGVISLGDGSGTEEPTNDNDPSTNPLAGEAPNNQSNRTLDFGFVPFYSLGNRVWSDPDNSGTQEAGELGLSGVSLRLLQSNGISVALDISGAAVLSQTTDADGYYRFDNLPAGDYLVEVLADNFSGSAALRGFASSNGAGQEADPNNNGDLNDNGLDPPVAGAIRSGVISLGPGESEPTNDDDPSTNPLAGEAPNNHSNRTVDFGFVPLSALGNRVWLDLNKDGVQDAGEPGVAGVPVTLYESDGRTVIMTTTTGADGLYLFEDLMPGTYVIGFDLPPGFARSPAGGTSDPEFDNDADLISGLTRTINLPAATTDLSWDAGIFYTASLGDRVWLDRNANGIQDNGEPGIPGIPVTLYAADGTTVISTTSTDANGFYGFENLEPMTYTIEFSRPNGFEISPLLQGSDPGADSDVNPATGRTTLIVIDPDEHDPTWDAGLFQRVRLGNLVWLDRNNNGLVDQGEAGIAGVPVQLYQDANADGVPDGAALASATTDGNGRYLFDNLLPGLYLLEITPPEGYRSSSGQNVSLVGPYEPAPDPNNDRDNDDNGSQVLSTTIRSGSVTLWSLAEPDVAIDGDDLNGNLTVDFGLFLPAALGNYTWYDRNGDGLKNPGEPGAPNILVTLCNPDGSPILNESGQPITTTTDTDGFFLFEQLIPGSYRVRFSQLPSGFTFTSPGGDSDANPNTGLTNPVTLEPGDRNLDLWAGLINPTAISLSSFVAQRLPGAVELRWQTGSEWNSLGFHILRSLEPEAVGAVTITPALIRASGSSQIGADYNWHDPAPPTGQRVYYWLQELALDGQSTIYGPVSVGPELSNTGFRVHLPLVQR